MLLAVAENCGLEGKVLEEKRLSSWLQVIFHTFGIRDIRGDISV